MLPKIIASEIIRGMYLEICSIMIGIAGYQLYVCQAYTTLSGRTSNDSEPTNP